VSTRENKLGLSEEMISAAELFEENLDHLAALALERMRIEWQAHRLRHVERLRFDLAELNAEFARLLRVVFRYNLVGALRTEAIWYASVLAHRNSPHDALRLLIESWVVAIEGIIPPPACNHLAQPLQQLLEDSALFTAPPEAPRSRLPDVEELISYLTRGELARALSLVRRRLEIEAEPSNIIPNFLLPTMAAIGSCWEKRELRVYQEHVATELMTRVLALLPSLAPPAPPLHQKALVSGAPDDHIHLVPFALAIYLELRGWEVISLGQGLPADEIVAAAQAFRPQVLFISLAMVSRVTGVVAALDQLRELPDAPLVIVGGRGAIQARQVLEAWGAHVAVSFEAGHEYGVRGGGPHA
jgi:methanogenic corrinoid protein MtbC1